MPKNWQDIHHIFDHELQERWENSGFSYEEAKIWIDAGLNPRHPEFCSYLKNQGKTIEWCRSKDGDLAEEYENYKVEETMSNLMKRQIKVNDESEDEENIEGENWESIHPFFSSGYNPTFKEGWKNKGFDYQETEKWIKVGLAPDEYEFAAYLRDNDYSSSETNIKELKKKYRNAQNWLDWHYPKKEKNKVTNLDIGYKNLEGRLIIEDFPNLKQVNCLENQMITSVILRNLPKLESFNASNCGLTDVQIENCPKINSFWVPGNPFANFDFNSLNPENLTQLSFSAYGDEVERSVSEWNLFVLAPFVKLELLRLYGNSFSGNLENLKELIKLKELDIQGTSIEGGLEYLPKSLESFNCSGKLLDQLKPFNYLGRTWKEVYQDLVKVLNNPKYKELKSQLAIKEQEIQSLQDKEDSEEKRSLLRKLKLEKADLIKKLLVIERELEEVKEGQVPVVEQENLGANVEIANKRF